MRNLILCFMTIKRPSTSYDYRRPSSPSSTTSLLHYQIVDPEPESEPEAEVEPDFAEVFASERLFFASPGSSNSIVESSPSDSSPADSLETDTYMSVDPEADFRKSMEEMVEARGLKDVNASWDYLQELLLCYLVLNPKHTHDFITQAFTDLLLALLTTTTSSSSSSQSSSSTLSRLLPPH